MKSVTLAIVICGILLGGAAYPAQPGNAEFLVGGDISMLAEIEDHGGVFRDDGKARDAMRILRDHGCNCFRLRIFVDPDGHNAVVQDLQYTVKMAQRIKESGAKLLLDFHYSDTWADPGKQIKPEAWEDLEFPALLQSVESYTEKVIARLREAGVAPDIVQPGNEIRPGMIWPDGKVTGEHNTEEQWDQLADLLRAAIRGIRSAEGSGRSIQIMLHPGGPRWKGNRRFFDKLLERGVNFDLIGLSYYPWWHGGVDNLRRNLRRTANRYGRDIMVVETAYPYRDADRWKDDCESGKNMAWPVSRAGQKQFLEDVVESVHATPEGRGKGVLWWYPESIPVRGLRIWHGGATALFDSDGNALPALDAFEASTQRSSDSNR